MCVILNKDQIRNEHSRGSVKVAPEAEKIVEKTLQGT